ncbi:MAG: hypothetical protein QG643_2453, partial [Pseudomonadota bacterium]|nr:hypothetical protein [Pseudomonadota bacterium]
ELLAEDLRAARLRNVEQQIKLLKSVGYTDIQCRKILIELSESAVAIGALVERGQVKRVELVEKDDG